MKGSAELPRDRRSVHYRRNPPYLRPRPVIADRLRGDDGEPAELTPGRRGSFWGSGDGLFSFDRSRSPDPAAALAVALRRALSTGRRMPRSSASLVRRWRQGPKSRCSEMPALFSFRNATCYRDWDALPLAARELCRLFPRLGTTS
jgi:hypothetical protein